MNVRDALSSLESALINHASDGIGSVKSLYMESEKGEAMHRLNDKQLLIEGLWMRLGVAIMREGSMGSCAYRAAIVREITHLLSCQASDFQRG